MLLSSLVQTRSIELVLAPIASQVAAHGEIMRDVYKVLRACRVIIGFSADNIDGDTQ